MAQIVFIQSKCGRCLKPFGETVETTIEALREGEKHPEPAAAPAFTLSFGGECDRQDEVLFDDLCPKCEAAVSNLVDRITLAKSDDEGSEE